MGIYMRTRSQGTLTSRFVNCLCVCTDVVAPSCRRLRPRRSYIPVGRWPVICLTPFRLGRRWGSRRQTRGTTHTIFPCTSSSSCRCASPLYEPSSSTRPRTGAEGCHLRFDCCPSPTRWAAAGGKKQEKCRMAKKKSGRYDQFFFFHRTLCDNAAGCEDA